MAHHLCTYRCMMLPGCVLINYIRGNICLLSNDVCREYMADEEFVVTYYGSKDTSCVKWNSNTIHARATTVAVTGCSLQPQYGTCLVGRLVRPPNTVPGNYYEHDEIISAHWDGTQSWVGEKEILNVQDGCQATWMPLTSGDIIPTDGVVGGYLARDGGIDLYIIRGQKMAST